MSLAGVYASVMSGSVVDNVMVLTGILIVWKVITHLVNGFCCLQICALQQLEFALFLYHPSQEWDITFIVMRTSDLLYGESYYM